VQFLVLARPPVETYFGLAVSVPLFLWLATTKSPVSHSQVKDYDEQKRIHARCEQDEIK
jgi:hypothetical protein